MRKHLRLILIAGAVGVFGLANPVSAQSPRFVYSYGATQNPSLQNLAQVLRDTRFLEGVTDTLSQAIKVPQNVALGVGECKQANAFYLPKQKAIIVCLELIQNIFITVPQRYQRIASSDEIGLIAGGALTFITLHELGHALIDLYSLPVLGKEEDAADQISSFLVLGMKDAKYGVAGAGWFFSKDALFYSRQHLSDAHSLDPQRRFNVYCWAYGSDPQTFSYLVQGGALPRERAPRCQAEYLQLSRSVKQLLGSYIR